MEKLSNVFNPISNLIVIHLTNTILDAYFGMVPQKNFFRKVFMSSKLLVWHLSRRDRQNDQNEKAEIEPAVYREKDGL